jgi:serine/threonine protein kinase
VSLQWPCSSIPLHETSPKNAASIDQMAKIPGNSEGEVTLSMLPRPICSDYFHWVGIRREILVHCQLKHNNIIELLGVVSDAVHSLAVIMPFVENGNSMHYLEDNLIHLLPIISNDDQTVGGFL